MAHSTKFSCNAMWSHWNFTMSKISISRELPQLLPFSIQTAVNSALRARAFISECMMTWQPGITIGLIRTSKGCWLLIMNTCTTNHFCSYLILLYFFFCFIVLHHILFDNSYILHLRNLVKCHLGGPSPCKWIWQAAQHFLVPAIQVRVQIHAFQPAKILPQSWFPWCKMALRSCGPLGCGVNYIEFIPQFLSSIQSSILAIWLTISIECFISTIHV